MIEAGTTYLVSNRCSERRFFLAPNDETNQLLRYCLAVTAERFDIQIHAFVFMANHLHFVLTDPKEELPRFMQQFGSLSARSMNVLLGRRESLWTRESYNEVRLADEDAVVRKAAYAIANPVLSDLVRRHAHWPGVVSRLPDLGRRAFQVQRPRRFFRENGELPETATLRLTVPPGFEDREAFTHQVELEVRRLESDAEELRRRKDKQVMGVRKLARLDPMSAPTSWKPYGRLRPLVACLDPTRRAEVLEKLRAFYAAYREAWNLWKQGRRDVVFPAGTWSMRVCFGAACAAPG